MKRFSGITYYLPRGCISVEKACITLGEFMEWPLIPKRNTAQPATNVIANNKLRSTNQQLGGHIVAPDNVHFTPTL